MRLAVQRIVNNGEAVEAVAFHLGYGSIAAFSREQPATRASRATVQFSPGSRCMAAIA
jgi:AraC-like DNA-binding protein